MNLKIVTLKEFETIIKPANIATEFIDCEHYFKDHISQAMNFAVGPIFWFIGSRKDSRIISVSSNINQLTPYSEQKWKESGASFLFENFHPDDSKYMLSAFIFALEIAEKSYKKNKISKVNVYGRMLDANQKYKWRLIQFPKYYFNINGSVESSLIVVTDISHLEKNLKPMVTYFDNLSPEDQCFKTLEIDCLINLNFPKISKREHEILTLMAKGLNSPQIAEKLFLSYHTVEKHKQNLRQKTCTKTSAELINYVWANNLI